MPAYWIARARIDDPLAYRQYTDRVPEILAAHGGRILARGGRAKVLEGDGQYTRFVVIEFPTLEAGEACFQSTQYQQAARFRRDGGGIAEIVIVEGV
jgi:uncharacterized protein (DUF1330 family)